MGFLVSKKRKPELQTLGGFLAYAKANKGKLNVGYGGVGSAGHMTTLAIQDQVGAEFNLVPYRGGGALTPDLLSGNLDAIVNFTGNYFAQLESGDFTVIGVARDDRSAFLPDAPTLKESGVDFSAAPWTIMQVRKGVPREIVNEMAQAVNEVLRDPTVAKRLVDARIQAAPSSPEAVDALVRAELERWRPVIMKIQHHRRMSRGKALCRFQEEASRSGARIDDPLQARRRAGRPLQASIAVTISCGV